MTQADKAKAREDRFNKKYAELFGGVLELSGSTKGASAFVAGFGLSFKEFFMKEISETRAEQKEKDAGMIEKYYDAPGFKFLANKIRNQK